MARHYRHSHLMSVLKGTDETIKENYSSAQYVEVWDTLLYNSVEPILTCCNLPDIVLSDIIHFYVENHRRKLSALSKDKVLCGLTLFLIAPESRKLDLLRKCRLERNVIRYVVTRFLEETADYQSLILKKARVYKKPKRLARVNAQIKRIEDRIGFSGKNDLFSTINSVRFWHEQANTFKNQILEKYIRLVVTQAQTYYKNNNSNMTLDDIIQNLFVFTSKALDKYDVNKGTISSYILQWFQHAKNMTVVQEDGIAFMLPVAKRSGVTNMAVSMENAEVLQVEYECGENVEVESTRRRVQRLAKLVDPTGLGRLSLGISEVLTREELIIMQRESVP